MDHAMAAEEAAPADTSVKAGAALPFATPWYHGWNVLAVCLLFQALSFGGPLFCFTFFVRPWTETFGVSPAEIIIGATAMQIAMGFSAPVIGRGMDRLSIRMLVSLGAGCLGLGLVLLSVATAAWQIVAIYATLIAAGLVLCGPLPAQTLAARWFSARQGLAIGLVTLGTSIGGVFLPPFMTGLIESIGWREALLVLAALTVVLIVPLTLLIVRNSPTSAHPVHSAAKGVGSDLPAAERWTTGRILRERNFWVVIVSFAPIMMAFGIVQMNLAPFTRDLGVDARAAALLMSVMAGATILGKLVFGGLADEIDHRRLYWAAAGMVVAGILALIVAGNYGLLLVITALLGFAAGSFLPLLGAVMARAFGPFAFGSAMGLAGPFLTITAAGAPLAAWLRAQTGSYEGVFLILVALIVPGALVMGFLRQRRPTAAPAPVMPAAAP